MVRMTFDDHDGAIQSLSKHDARQRVRKRQRRQRPTKLGTSIDLSSQAFRATDAEDDIATITRTLLEKLSKLLRRDVLAPDLATTT